VGCALDFITPDGVRIEVKEDHAAGKTGNFYLEYAQTFDGWKSSQWSGLFLAFEQADIFVVFVKDTAYLFQTSLLEAYDPFFQEDTPVRVTKAACNGNKPGAFSAGIVTSIKDITPFASQVFELRDGIWVERKRLRALLPKKS
jgi:hypothetical protein